MKITVISWMRNEEYILPFFFRHYDPHVDRYVIYDNMSTDRTRVILDAHPNVEVRPVDTGGKQDNALRAHTNSTAYRAMDADWFVVVDADEFMWHPKGLRAAIEDFHARGITVPLVQGWNMFHENLPQDDGRTPLTSIARHGCRLDLFHEPFTGWKPIPLDVAFLFDKTLVFHQSADMNYGLGQHYCRIGDACVYSPSKELFLLHYKWLSVWRKHPGMIDKWQGVKAPSPSYVPAWAKWFAAAMAARKEIVPLDKEEKP